MAGASPEVLSGLGHPEEQTRRTSIEAFLSERDLRALPDLRRIESSDESDELRFLARRAILHQAGALQPSADKRGAVRTPPLDDPDPARRVLSIGARAVRGRPDDIDRLVARLDVEEDPIVKAELALALGVAGGKAQVPALEKLLDDSNPDVRFAALEGLSLLRDPAAYPFLVRFAGDLDNRMRTHALRALAKLGRTNVLRLCQAMCKSTKEWMVFSGAHLLAGLKDPQYLPLFEELLDHPAADVRAKAREGVEQIAQIGDAAATELLAKIAPQKASAAPARVESRSRRIRLPDLGSEGLRDPDPAVRLKYIQLIENRKDTTAIGALIARLPLETDMRVLATLVATAGRMGDPAAVEELEELLDSPNDRVRANAVESIAQLAPLEDRRRLIRSLSDPHHRVRANAVIALWGSTQGPVHESLLALATHADRKCRMASIYAIGQIGEPASSLLHSLLVDADPEIAMRARECQQKIGLIEEAEPPPPPAPTPVAFVETTRPADLASLRTWVNQHEEDRKTALRDLAEAYRERVGKDLVPPPDICPLLAEVTHCWHKLKRDKPETKAAYHQKLETLGKALRTGKVWSDGPAPGILTRVDALEAELEAARPELEKLEKGSSLKIRRLLMVLGILVLIAIVAQLLGLLF